jgi:hypothetical protein
MADRTERDTRFAISYGGEDIKIIRGVGQPVVCFKKIVFPKMSPIKTANATQFVKTLCKHWLVWGLLQKWGSAYKNGLRKKNGIHIGCKLGRWFMNYQSTRQFGVH